MWKITLIDSYHQVTRSHMERIIGQGITQDIFSLNKLFKIHINLVFLISENISFKCSTPFLWGHPRLPGPRTSPSPLLVHIHHLGIHLGLLLSASYQSSGNRTRILAVPVPRTVFEQTIVIARSTDDLVYLWYLCGMNHTVWFH